MQKVTINVAALCDKGGRRANQDNICLSCLETMRQVDANEHAELIGESIALPPEGTLLVVADGMGGMNAGEVASQIVVDTLCHEMSAMIGKQMDDPEQASAVARRAVIDADNAIKVYVAEHPEASGTGSTVVLLWLLGDKAVVAWCGDSRCYRYNPRRGLEQLSHDHSYVQQLVDEGKLPPEFAFGHDQSNIITRCLSDGKEVAEPDVKVIDVYRDDMFLLCSDGLCGLLPDDVTEQLLKDAEGDAAKALSYCWRRGTDEGWDDNVSIIIATADGVDTVAPERKVEPLPQRPYYSTVTVGPEPYTPQPTPEIPFEEKKSSRRWLLPVAIIMVVSMSVLWFFFPKQEAPANSTSHPVPTEKTSPVRSHSVAPTKRVAESEETRPDIFPGEPKNNTEEDATSNNRLIQATSITTNL